MPARRSTLKRLAENPPRKRVISHPPLGNTNRKAVEPERGWTLTLRPCAREVK
jgi:hypothetical protein